jgi:hypothetical protein
VTVWLTRRSAGGYLRFQFWCGRTGPDGTVRVPLPPGNEIEVAAREPGFLFGDPVPAISGRDFPEVVLREAPGGDVELTVVDAENRPLPGVEIQVAVPDWVWLEGGEERLGLHTGPDGRIRLPRLPLAEVAIRGRYGSRRGTVEVRPPCRAVLRLPRR